MWVPGGSTLISGCATIRKISSLNAKTSEKGNADGNQAPDEPSSAVPPGGRSGGHLVFFLGSVILGCLVRFVSLVYLVGDGSNTNRLRALTGSRVMSLPWKSPSLRPELPACLSFPLPRRDRPACPLSCPRRRSVPYRRSCPRERNPLPGLLPFDAFVKGALHVVHGALELGDPLPSALARSGSFLGPMKMSATTRMMMSSCIPMPNTVDTSKTAELESSHQSARNLETWGFVLFVIMFAYAAAGCGLNVQSFSF